MSRDAAVTLDFGDATYAFKLGYGELVELQESVDAGPWYLLALFNGLGHVLSNPEPLKNLGVKIPREIIRIGLIGGGLKPVEALSKVRTYVEARPPDEYIGIAFQVLMAALRGAPDEDEIKKNKAAQESVSQIFPEEKSDLPQSSELAGPSATRQKK